MSIPTKLEYNIRDLINKGFDMSRTKDLTGQKFGMLEAIEFSHKDSGNNAMWLWRCDCGNTKIIRGSEVARGSTISCGCLVREKTRDKNVSHDLSRTAEYKAWINMKARCFNKSDMNYKEYGDRGITVCERWLNFNNFIEDMGMKPTKKHSLDRIDNNGNYEIDNCRWATPKEQIQNRRDSKWWYIDGVKYESHLDASRVLNIGARTVIQWCEGYWCHKMNKQVKPKDGCYSELKYKKGESNGST